MKKKLNEQISRIKDVMKKVTKESYEDWYTSDEKHQSLHKDSPSNWPAESEHSGPEVIEVISTRNKSAKLLIRTMQNEEIELDFELDGNSVEDVDPPHGYSGIIVSEEHDGYVYSVNVDLVNMGGGSFDMEVGHEIDAQKVVPNDETGKFE